jgi:hypothetical protein
MELKLTCQNTESFYAEQTVYLLIQKITRYRLESSTQIYIFFIYMTIFYYHIQSLYQGFSTFQRMRARVTLAYQLVVCKVIHEDS